MKLQTNKLKKFFRPQLENSNVQFKRSEYKNWVFKNVSSIPKPKPY